MTTTQNRQPVEVPNTYPRSPGRRQRSRGDQSLTALLTVYIAVLVIAGLLGGFLLQIMRGAS